MILLRINFYFVKIHNLRFEYAQIKFNDNNNNNNKDTYIAQIRRCSRCANACQRQTEMFSVCS